MVHKRSFLKKLFLVVTALGLTVVSTFLFIPGLNTTSRTTHLTVHRGMKFSAILDELHRNETITSTWPTLLTASIVPKLHNIKPGRYDIPPGMSNFGLLFFLHFSPPDEVRITLPEGINIRKVASILSRNLDMDSTGFMAAVSDRKFLAAQGIDADNAEGYLLPGTYNFVWSSTPEEAARFLIGRFRHFYNERWQNVAAQQGLSETGLLTLASIVESETPLDSEKALVASVYLNRLKANMRLQADPTVQYALGGTARRLYYKDLLNDSPYNTYRHNGLPPGPICNPGAASILAVLKPASSGFLYFVATGNGGHFFAESLSDHQANIKKYKSALRNASK
ncbi:MAG: endolytic transglycosylase MltG [Chlorobium sp.]|nr:MAG: endolytic transglycosylase MltG [Chlorobium sp.]